MFRSNSLIRRLSFALVAFSLMTSIVLPQQSKKEKKRPDQDPLSRERNVKPELREVYKKWLNEDVAYIITNEEKNAFKKLATDDEREQFIEAFWRRRDPDPDTTENEYREEYYERIAYTNEHFASGIPGWKTDRGRIYIRFGKADEVESHPSGGSYDRPYYEGGGSTTTYPFETWFYRYLEGVGSGIEIEFVDPTGTGEYHIARSPDEKDALLHVPGAGLTLNEQLGLSNKADRIGFGGQNGPNGYLREQDNPFTKLQTLADLERAPKFKETTDLTTTDTGTVSENPLDFGLQIDFFKQSDERVITAFTVQTENKDLVFADSGGIQTARMNIFARITSVAGKRSATFEDVVVANATPTELAEAKGRKSAYQKTVALSPGTYKIDAFIRDVKSGTQGVKHVGFTVPRYDSKQLATSTLVLAARLQSLADQVATGQFTIGTNKVIPNIAGSYRRGDPVGVYMQVYNTGIDQTTLRPSVDVNYVLMKDGKEVGRQPEDWHGLSDSGQRLTLARLLPTAGLITGNYELAVQIKDRVSGQKIDRTAKFKLVE
ncbi:MAG: GWxTD domain-containing protein [Pyrinomonadaceae bacterium]